MGPSKVNPKATRKNLSLQIGLIEAKIGQTPFVNSLKKVKQRAKDAEKPHMLHELEELVKEKINRKLFHVSKEFKKHVKMAKTFTIQKLVRDKAKQADSIPFEEHLALFKNMDVEQVSQYLLDQFLRREKIANTIARFHVVPSVQSQPCSSLTEEQQRIMNNNKLKKLVEQTETEWMLFISKLTGPLDMEMAKQSEMTLQGVDADSKTADMPPLEQKIGKSTLTGTKRKSDTVHTNHPKKTGQKAVGVKKTKRTAQGDDAIFVTSLNAKVSDDSASEAEGEDLESKKKNRPGQAARRKKYEEKYGIQANHLRANAEQLLFRDSKPASFQATRSSSKPFSSSFDHRSRSNNSNNNNNNSNSNNNHHHHHNKSGRKPSHESEKLHPSWEAKKKSASKAAILAFQGSKITFD